MSIDGTDRGGINLTGIPHNGGDTGQPDPVRARAELSRELDELDRRVTALEKERAEEKIP